MSMATAYGMRRRMAQGGMAGCAAHGKANCMACGGKMAEGGEVKGVHKTDHAAFLTPKHSSETGSKAGNQVRRGVGEFAKDEHKRVYGEMKEMGKKDRRNLAEGGFVEDEMQTGYGDFPEEHEKENSGEMLEDLVGEIMAKHYSQGGAVANDTPPIADSEEADYDVLPGMEDTEANYTGANSGDEIGDDQEDEDRDDIVSMAYRSWKKKDRNPRPA